MQRSFALGVVWVAVALVAVTIAWKGVAVVGDQVTDERPAPLAASDIRDRLDAATSTLPSDGSTSTSTATSTTVSTTTVSDDDPPAPTTGVSTAPSSPTTNTTTTTASTPTPTADDAVTRTYNLEGGTASLRFRPTGVEVVFATPAAGFKVEIEPEHGNGVKVEFESESHESRVDGWWDQGPVDRVREEPK